VSGPVERRLAWVHAGVWRVLADVFRVPKEPPTLPVAPGERCESFRPAPAFLSYLRLHFWVWLLLIDLLILAVWIAIAIDSPRAGAIAAVPLFLLAVVPDVVAYIAIHLRYETTWYVLSERSLRCRRGIWTITEHTITFENVQNVAVRSGPIERWFGIAQLIVETAGSEGGEKGTAVGNRAVVEGIDDAERLRVLVMEQVERSRGAGLGDDRVEPAAASAAAAGLGAAHVEALRSIRDEVRLLAAR
jgi:membrane protein YdbS with pleckstrin-like domain